MLSRGTDDEKVILLAKLDEFNSLFSYKFPDYPEISIALMDISTIISSPKNKYLFDEQGIIVKFIEYDTNKIMSKLPEMKKIILPNDEYNIVRTKCKLFEISLVKYVESNKLDLSMIKFINVLNNLIFARSYENFCKNGNRNNKVINS